METGFIGKGNRVAACLFGLLIAATMGNDLDAASATNQFITKPLATSPTAASTFRPANVPFGAGSFVLVPQLVGLEVEVQPYPIAVPPAAWQHKFDAHLVIVGRTEKNNDRLRGLGEGTPEGGVTVLRPESPKM